MEVTAQLFRALANPERTRILRVLTVCGEVRVGDLVDALSRLQGRVSRHLSLLATCGLVWRRRSGRCIYYRLADSPSNPVARGAVAFLRDVFGDVAPGEAREVAQADQRESAAQSDASLLSYFRAFTHPRRLQIIRHLSENGATVMEGLVESLHMSPPACSRHLANLTERDVVRREKAGAKTAFALSPSQDSARGRLQRVVVRHLVRPAE
jgi:DNA-binding transcriptional ArsR family regulator